MNLDGISDALNAMAGLTADDIDPALLSKMVSKVVPTTEGTFDWYLNLGGAEQAKATISADGRKTNAIINLEDIVQVPPHPEAKPQAVLDAKNSYQYTLRDRLPSRANPPK